MTEQPAVIVDHVTKRFADLCALDDVSLRVEDGEVFGVIGPNGAGKTTLVNLVTGMLEPDAGSVRTLGLDPIRDERRLREVVGVQFQEAQLRTPDADALSERELEVLRLVDRGQSNKEIAAALHISQATVKTHLIHIFRKLDVSDRTAALERGLLSI